MLYGAMVKFSMLAVTCSLQGLDAIIELVKAENIPFQEGVNSGCHYTRKLAVIFSFMSVNMLVKLIMYTPTVRASRHRGSVQSGNSISHAVSPQQMPAQNVPTSGFEQGICHRKRRRPT